MVQVGCVVTLGWSQVDGCPHLCSVVWMWLVSTLWSEAQRCETLCVLAMGVVEVASRIWADAGAVSVVGSGCVGHPGAVPGRPVVGQSIT